MELRSTLATSTGIAAVFVGRAIAPLPVGSRPEPDESEQPARIVNGKRDASTTAARVLFIVYSDYRLAAALLHGVADFQPLMGSCAGAQHEDIRVALRVRPFTTLVRSV